MPAAAAARVVPWVEELARLGHKVSVFTSSSAFDDDEKIVKSFFRVPDNKASLGKRFFQEILLGLDLGLRIFLSKKNTKFCLISSPPFFMACICAFFAWISNIPYVFDVRDRYPRVLTDLGVIKTSSFLFKLLGGLESWVYQNALQITTVTQGLVQELQLRFPNLNIFLVRNGFDEEVFTEHILNSAKASAFTVVYHGRLGRFYDLDAYLEIMNLVYEIDPSIRFLMIGNFPENFTSRSPENLEILPVLPLRKLNKLLSASHLGICLLRELPAMKKAFPAKAYDYIGAGLPILAGPSGELVDMVARRGIGVTFSNISPKVVADSIVGIKNDQVKWAKMCKAVKESRMHFGRRKIAKTYFTKELSLFTK